MSVHSNLWRYNATTGLWVHERMVAPDTAQQWLAVFRRHEPQSVFLVAKNRPRKVPRWDPELRRHADQSGVRGRRRRHGNKDTEIDPDAMPTKVPYCSHTIEIVRVAQGPEMWRAEVYQRERFVWPCFGESKAKAMARAMQLIDREKPG